jgi:TetR/AcrR family transcriptional repressor of uid operon
MEVHAGSGRQGTTKREAGIEMTDVRSRRVETPEVRRAQILEAAKQCFRETGFYAATMAEIADLAGVSVGLLYRHFQSKDDIVKSIVEQDLETQQKDLKSALDAHIDDPAAAVEEIIKTFARGVLDHERTSLMVEIAAESMRNPDIQSLGAEGQKKLVNLWQKRFTLPGVPTAEMPARLQIAAALFTGIGLQLHPRKDKPGPALMELIAHIARQILAPPNGPKTKVRSRRRPDSRRREGRAK